MKLIALTFLCSLLWHSAFADETNALITVTAPAKFEQRGGLLYLIIKGDADSFDVLWSEEYAVTLRSNQVYTFTVRQTEYRSPTKTTIKLPPGVEPLPEPPSMKIPWVVRIVESGKAIYDREVCEVHKRRMDYKEVPILYGLIRPGPDEPSGVTAQKFFPHRHEVAFGGCCIPPDRRKTDNVYVCSECKKAYDKWKTENRNAK